MTDATAPTAPTTTADAPAAPTKSVAARMRARAARTEADNPVPAAEPALDGAAAVAPSVDGSSGSDSAAGAPDEVAAGSSPAAPGSSPAAPTTHDLLAEKLKAIRQQNRERRDLAEGRRAREQGESEAARLRAEAEADRRAAATERATWEGARKDYKTAFDKLGLNAREVYEEMTKQAIEAGTPEGQLRAAQAAWKDEMDSLRGEVKTLREERDAARARDQEQARESAFEADYSDAIKGSTAYDDLRDAYDDRALVGKATFLRDDPDAFYEHARQHNVRLTNPAKGYTMTDILNVLAAVHARYEETRAQRRAARTAAPASQAATNAAPPSTSTVNGTAAPRNAGAETIGNDLATARAADGKFAPKGTTAAQRIRERARR